MQYQNYLIEYKQIDSNLFVKLTDKNSKISYENTITPEQIDNLPISKFIKIFENCIKSITNYYIIIETSNEENQLILSLTYNNEIIDLLYTIHLEKTSSTNTNNTLLKRIEQLEKIIDENNQITIAKIFNIEIQNDNMTKLTTNYIRYPKNTEHIEINLPDDTYDVSRNIKKIYQLQFNYDIDPNEIFTNLKKITTNRGEYLIYFTQTTDYLHIKKNIDSYNICINNNTIEEIDINNNENFNNTLCHLENAAYNLIKYNKFSDPTKSYSGLISNMDYPKLTKIKVKWINLQENFLKFVKQCKKLKKIILCKIINRIYRGSNNNLQEIRNYCSQNSIELEIGEIIIQDCN